jgi:hypothetical protein
VSTATLINKKCSVEMGGIAARSSTPRLNNFDSRTGLIISGGVVAAAAAASAPLSTFPPAASHGIIMSSASFWSDACKNAKGRPLQTLLDALYASCGVTVRPARAAACVLLADV